MGDAGDWLDSSVAVREMLNDERRTPLAFGDIGCVGNVTCFGASTSEKSFRPSCPARPQPHMNNEPVTVDCARGNIDGIVKHSIFYLDTKV